MSYEEDNYEETDREPFYKRNRAALPGLLQLGKTREYVAYAVAAVALVYAGASRWQSSSQLSACKAEKQNGFVVVLDANGSEVNAQQSPASEFRLASLMVVDKLKHVVVCLRGLDPAPRVVVKCWEDASPLFYGEAKNKFTGWSKEMFPNVDSITRKLQAEWVSVKVDGWSQPDAEEAPGRFWLHWTETHHPRNGREFTETWAGTFDVDLVPLDPKQEGGSGLHIVRWEWSKAPDTTKGAG